jgi:4-hydroxybenzoate polyprenyltransferase
MSTSVNAFIAGSLRYISMIVDLLKLSRPRTWAFVILAFFIGWSLTGSPLTMSFLIGLLAYLMLVGNVNLLNSYTDIEEDRINVPHRTKYIEKIGYDKLPFIVSTIYLLSILMVYFLPFWFFVTFIIAVLDNAFYSIKPFRFKANPMLSLLSFSGAVFFPMLGAWTISRSIFDTPLIIFFLSYAFLVYGTVKNIPDYEGDKRTGLKTTATIFKKRESAIKFASVLLLSPYVALLLLILYNLLDSKFSILFISLPLIIWICKKTLQSKSFEKLEKLHTYGFLYQVSFLSLAYLIISPSLVSVSLLFIMFLIQFLIIKTRFDSR